MEQIVIKDMQASRYQTTPCVETECSPNASQRLNRKRFATDIFRSSDIILNPRISLPARSIAIKSQINSEPILFCLSSTMNLQQLSDFNDHLLTVAFFGYFSHNNSSRY